MNIFFQMQRDAAAVGAVGLQWQWRWRLSGPCLSNDPSKDEQMSSQKKKDEQMHTKTITSSSGLQTIDRSNNRRTVVSGCIELKLQRRIDGVGHRCRPAGRGPPLSVSPSIIVVAASTLQCHRNDAQPSSHHRSTFLSLYSAYISPSLQLHTHTDRQTCMPSVWILISPNSLVPKISTPAPFRANLFMRFTCLQAHTCVMHVCERQIHHQGKD